MTAPATYAEWLPLIERFRDGDDSALEAMYAGSIEWTAVVAERWTRRLDEALQARLLAVEKRLQVDFDRSEGDSFVISRAVLGARRAIAPLQRFASLPSAPEEVRNHLQQTVTSYVERKQQALEAQAAKFRHDNGRTLKAIRDNPLTAPDVSSSSPPETAEPTAAGARRRVLL